jgi:ribokinase
LSTVDVLALIRQRLREDEKIPAQRVLVDGGGPAGTAACAAARYGAKTAVFSFIGQDLWRDFVRGGFRSFGVATRFLQVRAGMATPVSMIAVNRDTAARTIFWNNQGAGRQKIDLARLIRQGILDTRCLHHDGHLMDLSIKLAASARKRGILNSYDCGSVKPGWEKLAALTDIFIASHQFARQLRTPAPRLIAGLRRRFGGQVAVTAGEKGFYYHDADQDRIVLVPQRKTSALDTTGCGDVFHGAFLAHYLKRRSFPDALRFAQAAAGAKTRALGGRAGLLGRGIFHSIAGAYMKWRI